ncbi:MAG: MBL fold metallo-hydrolase [Chloroflexi bacterium]|nr:MBL fold metallo-hydrolase [Chloroflexota bacterium]
MLVDMLPIGPLPTNAYVVTCSQTRQAVIIDPGWPDPALMQTIENREAQVTYIVNTHTHWDHIGGNAAVAQATGAPLLLHAGALPLLRERGAGAAFGIELEPSPEPERFLEPGETLEVGALTFDVLFTPGHAPGHISLYSAGGGAVFSGDVLFNKGVGRFDLPGGSWPTLEKSIREVLFTLPDETVVYSGHGPKTTIGEEKLYNPFL